jgi:hypothetical protein
LRSRFQLDVFAAVFDALWSLPGLVAVFLRCSEKPLPRACGNLNEFGTLFRLGAFALWMAVFALLGVPTMNRNDQYVSHAADCQLMACMTRDEHERQTWLEMAQTWLRLVELPKRPSSSFTFANLLSRTERNHFGNAA